MSDVKEPSPNLEHEGGYTYIRGVVFRTDFTNGGAGRYAAGTCKSCRKFDRKGHVAPSGSDNYMPCESLMGMLAVMGIVYDHPERKLDIRVEGTDGESEELALMLLSRFSTVNWWEARRSED